MTIMTVSVLVVVIIDMSWIIKTVVMIRIVIVEMMATYQDDINYNRACSFKPLCFAKK